MAAVPDVASSSSAARILSCDLSTASIESIKMFQVAAVALLFIVSPGLSLNNETGTAVVSRQKMDRGIGSESTVH